MGCRSRLLTRAELRRWRPIVSEPMVGGAFCPIEGKANPLEVTPAFARAAQAARRAASIAIPSCRRSSRRPSGFIARHQQRPIRGAARRQLRGRRGGPDRAPCSGIELSRSQGFPIQVNVTEPVAPLIQHLVYFAGER